MESVNYENQSEVVKEAKQLTIEEQKVQQIKPILEGLTYEQMCNVFQDLKIAVKAPVQYPLTEENMTMNNLRVKEELWGRGYFVWEIGRGRTVDYLIVSVAPPQSLPINHNSN